MEFLGAAWQNNSLRWTALPDNYTYVPGEAHVFSCPVLRGFEGTEGESLLAGDEPGSPALHSESSQRSSMREISSAMRYFLCGLCLGVTPTNLRFNKTSSGKPSVLVGDYPVSFHFSQSHTDACVVMAVCDMPCGVDVERVTDPLAYPHLSRRGLPEEWIRELCATKEETEAGRLFTTYWTALESLFKLYGGQSFISFLREVKATSENHAIQTRFNGLWGLHFEVDEEHLACLTLPGRPSNIRGFRLSATDLQSPS